MLKERQLQQHSKSTLLAQVKELAAQVLPLEMVALSSEPAPHPDEALPPAETHQVQYPAPVHTTCSHSGIEQLSLKLSGHALQTMFSLDCWKI